MNWSRSTCSTQLVTRSVSPQRTVPNHDIPAGQRHGAGRHHGRPTIGAVPDRPYVLLSAAMSVDGYLDDATLHRLILSSDADLDRVDEVRASADAIMVGATTIRRDKPWLRVRSAARREARLARGELADPVRVTMTRSGNLDPAARFFTRSPPSETVLVYVPESAAGDAAA